jgi:hypothetical protein
MGEIDGRDQHDERRDAEEERERQQRLAALQSLAERANQARPAQRAAAAATTSSRLGRSGPSPWRLLLVGLVAVVVLAAGGVAAYQFTHRTTRAVVPPIPSALTIDLTNDKLNCPAMMAWSPDSARLAVLARTGFCDRPSNQDVTVLAIYDTRTGKLAQRFKPDDLLANLGFQGRTYGGYWSPDGATLALGAIVYPAAKDGQFSQGLLLVSAQQGAARLIQGQAYDPNKEPPHLTYDAANGQVAWTTDANLPMALTYRWTPGGHIVAETPMPSGGAGATPAASPGATSLSRWHSGTLEHIDADRGDGNFGQIPSPVAWYLDASIPTWSPDGHYYTELMLTTRLTADGKPAAPITAGPCASNQVVYASFTAVCAQAGIRPPDAALAAALAAAQAGHPLTDQAGTSYGTVWNSVSVDWRPDGKVLAAIFPADGFENQSSTVTTVKVTLLDTATGKTLATLSAKRRFTNGSSSTPGVPYTAWSPSGQQLAFEDYFSGRITIWGSESLAALPK